MGKLSFAAALSLVALVAAQYEYDYSYGYDNAYDDSFGYGYGDEAGAGGSGGYSYGGEYYDEYGYYADDDASYYEYYGYYADDFAGYEDYYVDGYNEEYGEYDFFEECFFDANSKPTLVNGTASCDLKISGVNKQADKLTGGIDGTYKLSSCYNGKAMYSRTKPSPDGEDRVLWYSSTFGDWDLSRGKEPNEAEILMYGGEMEHASVPLFVTSWHLGGDLRSGGVEDEYAPISVKVSCADGTVYDESEVRTTPNRVGPVLTDEEMDAKYRYIYDKYMQSSDPSPSVNFTFVVLLVMTGLTVVLAIPYFLLKKKGVKGGSISSSFAQMLQQTKKKSAGHVN